MPSSSIFNITFSQSFATELVKGIIARFGHDPFRLAKATLLLPTKQSLQTVTNAFKHEALGRTLLLPTMRTLDDAHIFATSASSSSTIMHSLMLARIIQTYRPSLSIDQALHLSQELLLLFNEMEREQCPLSQLQEITTAEEASHQQQSISFLNHMITQWQQHNYHTDATIRNNNIAALIAKWHVHPPVDPIIIAGSTGSIPAISALIRYVSTLDHGYIVLSGIDQHMDAESWDAIDPCHPQYYTKKLLVTLAIDRYDITSWSHTPSPSLTLEENITQARSHLLSYMMLPAHSSHQWKQLSLSPLATQGLSYVECGSLQEEATIIALKLRHHIEHTDTPALCVTADDVLAARIHTILQQWNITAHYRPSQTTTHAPPITFLLLLLDYAHHPDSITTLLALLKHPYSRCGVLRDTHLHYVYRLEKEFFRTTPAKKTLEDIINQYDKEDSFHSWLHYIIHNIAPLMQENHSYSFTELFALHIHIAEQLAHNDEQEGATVIWEGEDGQHASTLCRELHRHTDGIETLTLPLYRNLLRTLLHYTPSYPIALRDEPHAPIHILSPMDARLHHGELIILAGLNETIWPASPTRSTWLTPQIRQACALPPEEVSIGLAAHDFCQHFCAPEVMLTRAVKQDGKPAAPARWLLRLQALLDNLATRNPQECFDITKKTHLWHHYAQLLWHSEHRPTPTPPAPAPPREARPNTLSATAIEALLRDPYSVYAKHILKLKPLADIDHIPGRLEYGITLHDIFDRFIVASPTPKTLEHLLRLAKEILATYTEFPHTQYFWWERFYSIATQFIAIEEERDASIISQYSELSATMLLKGITLYAKADRLDIDDQERTTIIDYKTGTPPSNAEVLQGKAPQLLLEALLFHHQGYQIDHLEYWHISGKEKHAIHRHSILQDENIEETLKETQAALERLIDAFYVDLIPYRAEPHAMLAPKFNDYSHLSRKKEWAA